MPRSKRIFKKKKTVPPKREKPPASEPSPSTSSAGEQPSRRSTRSTPSRGSRSSSGFRSIASSTSSHKLSTNQSLYDQYESPCNDLDLVNIELLGSLIEKSTKCKTCNGSVSLQTNKRSGVAVTVSLICENCDLLDEVRNSQKVIHEIDGVDKTFDSINLAMVYAFRRIGRGFEPAKLFCGLLNMSPPPAKYNDYQRAVTKAAMQVGHDSMRRAVEEAVELNNDDRDLAVSIDGTWQKRGHNSLNGVVSAVSVDNCKVVDVAIMSKFCKCKERGKNIHEDSCGANYKGTSGGMETFGVEEIFIRSLPKYNVRYTQYLGDGDSKAYSNIRAKKPYGNIDIIKLECIGHIQKRMASRLKKLKAILKKLSDGKTIGGKGRLTDAAIHDIAKYYGLAIRRYCHDLELMIKQVWAMFFHLSSTDEDPCHQLCDADWCKYRKAQAEGKTYRHSEHLHLPRAVMEAIKPIFKDLSKRELLSKCLHGGTQNPNESFNHAIWGRIPKNVFVGLDTLHSGVFDAVSSYNEGNIACCQVLQILGFEPGSQCVKALKRCDDLRVKKSNIAFLEASKEARQKKSRARKRLEEELEEAEGTSYGAGDF